ncbi:MAG: regulatory protein RecX [bacterium]|jgi:regulatory protein
MDDRKKIYDKKSAKVKIEQYCAYQERSQQEVRDKLYDMGLHKDDVENIITELIDNNFLNEERFAITYARGKFRIKHWGKIKIKQHLKQKKVGDYCINKALALIDPNDYEKTIIQLIEKKNRELKESDAYIKKQKVTRYVVSRGFETDIVLGLIGGND